MVQHMYHAYYHLISCMTILRDIGRYYAAYSTMHAVYAWSTCIDKERTGTTGTICTWEESGKNTITTGNS